MPLDSKVAVSYGGGGSIGGVVALRRDLACERGPHGIRVAPFAPSDHARTMTATAPNITCGAVVD